MGASPMLLLVTSTALISSVSSSIPRWTFRQMQRLAPPCLRAFHSPSPSASHTVSGSNQPLTHASMRCRATDQQRTAPFQGCVVRLPVCGAVGRGCGFGHPRELTFWSHAGNPCRFVRQSRVAAPFRIVSVPKRLAQPVPTLQQPGL